MEQKELNKLVDEFAKAMKTRLKTKRKQGWCGWESPKRYDCSGRLLKNAAKGVVSGSKKSLVDVANLAMFLWKNPI